MTDTTRRLAQRPRHLRLVRSAPADDEPAPKRVAVATAQELEEMSRIAAYLRTRAARLPEWSALRAELLESAEYYTLAVAGQPDAGSGTR